MKRPTLRFSTFLCCLVLLTLTASVTRAVLPQTVIADLSWISGDWQTTRGKSAQVEEHWTKPAGATMMGMSRTVAGEKTVEFEYLRVEQRANGIYYVAYPDARCPGTDFKLTKLTEQEAVFENPQHDFPKRITYRKTSADLLTASIDGGEGTKSIAFVYQRMQ